MDNVRFYCHQSSVGCDVIESSDEDCEADEAEAESDSEFSDSVAETPDAIDSDFDGSDDGTTYYLADEDNDLPNDGVYMSRNNEIEWSVVPKKSPSGRRTSENVVKFTAGPSRHANRNVDGISSTFQLFITNNITHDIMKWTNAEGRRILGKNWKEIDANELFRSVVLKFLCRGLQITRDFNPWTP